MASKSSFLLAVLLIANPFMLLVFQNCSSASQDRNIASLDKPAAENSHSDEIEFSLNVGKNLKIK